MSWAVGFDSNWGRDVGYGVPAVCDHPDCTTPIDRGLGYVCGEDVYGGEHGCGLYFCAPHLVGDEIAVCERCATRREPFEPSPDTAEWTTWKLTHPSWAQWRTENPETVARLLVHP